jgi:dTDP-glucose pyrophosphorylase
MKINDSNKQIQLVLPMAGSGNRFKESGYKITKPLLPVHGIPMFKVVLANLISEHVKKIVIISQIELNLQPQIEEIQQDSEIEFKFIEIDYVTEGPASTVKLAEQFIDLDQPVVTANTDQYLNTKIDKFYEELIHNSASGTILTMEDNDPKWSFVKLDSKGNVIDVQEKQVISKFATVGIYGFKQGKLLFDSIQKMVNEENKVNGEYYIAPIYNYLIKESHQIKTLFTGTVNEIMFGMGIPEDYEKFILNPVSRKAAFKAIRFE